MKKVLIANRGEIAVRIINACHELGLQTVAVYSEADNDSLHVKYADEAYKIGPSKSSDSYLSRDKLITVAKLTNSDAIHPGYGFLSEDPKFINMCESNGIIFIGPSLENITFMSNKYEAKKMVNKLGVPVIPGIDKLITSKNMLKEQLSHENLHFPILLKAASGGGGKGIKLCKSFKDAVDSYDMLADEAEGSFNDAKIYVEEAINIFTHIEVQILGDGKSNYICLGERNCTLQRHMQKMIEESPTPGLPDKTRKNMYNDSIKICKKLRYKGAGTIEYLYDRSTDNYYFMEMNTRIQVEHGVSELACNIDIVQAQLTVAEGLGLPDNLSKDIIPEKHAIECRILAEQTDNNFFPSIGKIGLLAWPTGNLNVRTDTFIYSGYTNKIYYDSLLAKIIVCANTREQAIRKMEVSLGQTNIDGIDTNIPFLSFIMQSHIFQEGKYNNHSFKKILSNYLDKIQ